jgi:beta-galactosidase
MAGAFEKSSSKSPPVFEEGIGEVKSEIFQRSLAYFAVFFLFLYPIFISAQLASAQTKPSKKFERIIPSNNNIKPPGRVQETNFFPFSVWYSGGKARAPLVPEVKAGAKEKWLKDLQQIKSLGFNMVRTWISWSDAEPREGEYHFEHLKLLLKLAHQVGLKVFIQMYVDSAPEWVGEKFGKSALFQTQSGHKIIPQAAPGYSMDHPGVRKAIAELYSKTAEVAVQYPNFHGWDIWSEPHIINWIIRPWVQHAQFGFNPYTQDRFRQWLKRKYHSLDSLNAAWGRHYLHWSEVSAPRCSTILSYTDFIDWKLFLYAKLAGDMRLKYNAIRRVDSTHVITAHASPPSILSSPMSGKDAANDFQRARQLDYYGLSMYPKHNNHKYNWSSWILELEPDFSYSANMQHGGFYVGELQAGQGTVGLKIGDPIKPSDEREWIWTAIAAGAKAINIYAYYPMSTGYESGGYGLINLDGSLTKRAKEAGHIAKTVTNHGKLFENSPPVKAQIALLYNPLSQMIGGYNNVGTRISGLHSQALIGYWRYFNQHNIPVNFIDRETLEKDDLSQYKLIIAPYSLMFTQNAAEGLMDYVRKGGHVVGEARMGWNDKQGDASKRIPGLGLAKMFGVQEGKISKRKKFLMNVTDDESTISQGLRGDTLTGALFAESLKPLPHADHKAEILAAFEDGTPAITSTQYGKGKALYIGSFLGLARQRFPHSIKNDDHLFHNLLKWAHVQLPLTTPGINGEHVEVRLHKNGNSSDYLLFMINHDSTENDVVIHLNMESLGIKNSRNIVLTQINGNKKMKKKPTGNTLTIQTNLPEKGVEVWRVHQIK